MMFVTGSNGFIARNLIAAADCEVGCYDVMNRTDPDICAILDVVAWRNVTSVYHIGAIADTTETDIDKLYEHNVKFTIKLFERAAENGIPINYISSAAVYGNTTDYSMQPLNQYAMTKAMVDQYVMDNLEPLGFVKGWRLFNVYGENERCKGNMASAYYKFEDSVRRTNMIEVFEGSEDFKRDFIHVDHVVDLLLNSRITKSGIYDVGMAEQKSFMDVAKEVQARYPGSIIRTIPFPEHLKGKYQTSTKAQYPWQDLMQD
jgi:ADP-L-glycero-D-manno-heptose 6-epimerase